MSPREGAAAPRRPPPTPPLTTQRLPPRRRTSDELLLDEGPLAEIAFWTSRAADLGGINLSDPGLLRILRVLEAAKSPYLPTFQNLGESIQQAGYWGHCNPLISG